MNNLHKIEYVYIKHYNYFLVVAYNICHDREIAKDIVQDGFIRIIDSTEIFADIPHVRRYLTGCVRNAAFARLKSDARIKAMRHDFLHTEGVNEALIAKMRKYVRQLRCPMIRKVIEEIYFQKKTQQEVALHYGINRRTIATKHKKGLKQLFSIITIHTQLD